MAQKNEELLYQARGILLAQTFGVLSSHSTKLPGYSHTSILPYVVDGHGRILILISRLAQHTRNIKKNPKVSLFVMADIEGDVQSKSRLSISCDALELASQQVEAVAGAYYARFPHSLGYHNQLDFEFYELQIKEVGYIAGFGAVKHFDAAQWLKHIQANGTD
jgi:hypothetical protein